MQAAQKPAAIAIVPRKRYKAAAALKPESCDGLLVASLGR